jgi:hypothetical protein
MWQNKVAGRLRTFDGSELAAVGRIG